MIRPCDISYRRIKEQHCVFMDSGDNICDDSSTKVMVVIGEKYPEAVLFKRRLNGKLYKHFNH